MHYRVPFLGEIRFKVGIHKSQLIQNLFVFTNAIVSLRLLRFRVPVVSFEVLLQTRINRPISGHVSTSSSRGANWILINLFLQSLNRYRVILTDSSLTNITAQLLVILVSFIILQVSPLSLKITFSVVFTVPIHFKNRLNLQILILILLTLDIGDDFFELRRLSALFLVLSLVVFSLFRVRRAGDISIVFVVIIQLFWSPIWVGDIRQLIDRSLFIWVSSLNGISIFHFFLLLNAVLV